MHEYNCTKHESTKFSLFELMIGITPKLPIYSVFETTRDEIQKQTTAKYVSQYSETARGRQKQQHNKKAKAVKINIGD